MRKKPTLTGYAFSAFQGVFSDAAMIYLFALAGASRRGVSYQPPEYRRTLAHTGLAVLSISWTEPLNVAYYYGDYIASYAPVWSAAFSRSSVVNPTFAPQCTPQAWSEASIGGESVHAPLSNRPDWFCAPCSAPSLYSFIRRMLSAANTPARSDARSIPEDSCTTEAPLPLRLETWVRWPSCSVVA